MNAVALNPPPNMQYMHFKLSSKVKVTIFCYEVHASIEWILPSLQTVNIIPCKIQ